MYTIYMGESTNTKEGYHAMKATLGKVWTIPLEHKGIADFSSSCSTHTLGSTVRILVLTNVSPFCNHVPHVLWEFSNYLCQDVN